MIRRQIAPELPALSAVYGLRWADIETMPAYELAAYRAELEQWARILAGVPNQ